MGSEAWDCSPAASATSGLAGIMLEPSGTRKIVYRVCLHRRRSATGRHFADAEPDGVLLGKSHPRVRLRAVTAGVCSIARLTEQESAGEAADSMRLLVRRVVAYNSTQAGMQPAQRCP